MSIPYPDQPLPDGWVYIEHPSVGRAENPVPRDALPTWIRAGWTEAADEPPATADAADSTANPRRTRAAAATADQVKE